MTQYFEIGKECEVYGSFDEMYEKVNFYIKHDELRKTIAKRGHEKAVKDFAFKSRVEHMLSIK